MATVEAQTAHEAGDPPGGVVYDAFISYSHAADEDAPCNCPQTEMIVLDIDWVGDGTAATSHNSFGLGAEGEEVAVVDLAFEAFDSADAAEAALSHALQNIEVHHLQFEPFADRGGTIQLDGARATFDVPFVNMSGSHPPMMRISVGVGVDAAEALQPLVDVLGTIDP